MLNIYNPSEDFSSDNSQQQTQYKAELLTTTTKDDILLLICANLQQCLKITEASLSAYGFYKMH